MITMNHNESNHQMKIGIERITSADVGDRLRLLRRIHGSSPLGLPAAGGSQRRGREGFVGVFPSQPQSSPCAEWNAAAALVLSLDRPRSRFFFAFISSMLHACMRIVYLRLQATTLLGSIQARPNKPSGSFG
jgi:hypothetical protein